MFEFPFFSSLSFPSIDPIAFSIGPIHMRWYGIGYVVGILFCWWYSLRLLKKTSLWPQNTPPMSATQLDDFVVWATIGVVLGGRLGNVLFWYPSYYFSHPSEIFAIWHGGMAFHGGLVGVILALCLYTYRHHLPLWSSFDAISAGVPVGLFFVRICNFINGELWGRPSTLPWAMVFPDAGPLPRHPSQLYEAASEGALLFLILAIAIFLFKATKRPGLVSGLFSLGYGLARIGTEVFRNPDAAPHWFETSFAQMGLSYGMFLSLPMLLLGIFLILSSKKREKNYALRFKKQPL